MDTVECAHSTSGRWQRDGMDRRVRAKCTASAHRDGTKGDGDSGESHELCLSYAVRPYAECAPLDAVFLPFCSGSNGTVSRTSERVLRAEAVELYGASGVAVEIEHFAREFTLCLSSERTEAADFLRSDSHSIEVVNWAVFHFEGRSTGCTNNDGIPCLNVLDIQERGTIAE